jgi:hypothetical protein
MSEINSEKLQEVVDLVERAQSKGTFKLEEVIKGQGHPEDIVEVYLNSDAGYKLSKLSDELASTVNPEELVRLEAEADALKAEILKSKLVFHMRGIDQSAIELIEKQAQEANKNNPDEDAWIIDYFCALIASNVFKVEDADGNVDDSVFTIEDAKKWRGSFPIEAWSALTETMQKLTLATGYFKGLTDAGFLPKS